MLTSGFKCFLVLGYFYLVATFTYLIGQFIAATTLFTVTNIVIWIVALGDVFFYIAL